MKRPGYDETAFRRNLCKARQAGADVWIADVPQIDISSTKIRAAAAAGEALSDAVPAPVRDYILRKRLYRPEKWNLPKFMKT